MRFQFLGWNFLIFNLFKISYPATLDPGRWSYCHIYTSEMRGPRQTDSFTFFWCYIGYWWSNFHGHLCWNLGMRLKPLRIEELERDWTTNLIKESWGSAGGIGAMSLSTSTHTSVTIKVKDAVQIQQALSEKIQRIPRKDQAINIHQLQPIFKDQNSSQIQFNFVSFSFFENLIFHFYLLFIWSIHLVTKD